MERPETEKYAGAMAEKVCLITGATSGIGKATAMELANMGASVVMVGRDRGRGEAAQAEIKEKSTNASIDLMLADLSSQEEIRRLADEFEDAYPRLDVLINNAGLFRSERITTADGLEMTFAVNHLAYFLLTNLLLDVLRASAPSRIVNVSSGDHTNGTIDFDDLQGERGYKGARAYSQSKLANVLFTHELARRLEGTGVSANCLHPGAGIRTNFGSGVSGVLGFMVRALTPLMKSPEKGAETSVYLAASPKVEGLSGGYFAKKAEARSSDVSHDERIARRLWEVSAGLTNLPGKIRKEGETTSLDASSPAFERVRTTNKLGPQYALTISAQRYALFDIDERGFPVLRKVSAHSLGYPLPPRTEKQAPPSILRPNAPLL